MTLNEQSPGQRLSPHFFRREADGSVRLRIRFTAEEAALIEEAAGDTPLLLYIHRVLGDRARYHIKKREESALGVDLEEEDTTLG
jgi:hypothetical protein